MPAEKTMSPAQRARYYRSLIQEAEQKGLQLKEVEAAHGLKPGRLSKWRYEREGRGRQKKGAAVSKPKAKPNPKRKPKPSGKADSAFVPVKVVDKPPEPSKRPAQQGYEIALANGRTVRVPGDFDSAQVVALVVALEAAC